MRSSGALSRTRRNFRPMGLFLGLGLELKMGRPCHKDDPAPSSARPIPTTKQPPPRSNSTQSPPSLITVFIKYKFNIQQFPDIERIFLNNIHFYT